MLRPEDIQDAIHIEPSDKDIDSSTLSTTDTSGFLDYDTAKARAIAEDDGRTEAAVFRARIRSGKSSPGETVLGMINDFEAEAERMGDWAQLLHEHPISEEYRASHPNVNFTPQLLRNLEETLRVKLDMVADYEKKLEEVTLRTLFDTKDTNPTTNPDTTTIFRIAGILGGDDRFNEVEAITSNPDTTVSQLLELYEQLYRELKIDPVQNEANLIKVTLEDIRSGRASDSHLQQPTSEENQ